MGAIGLKIQNGLPVRENVVLVQYAEARGLASVWVSEYRREPIVPMAVFAAATERIAVGSAILQIYTRSAPAIAMAAASLADLAPGRIVLGLGAATDPIVERWHGGERVQPVAAVGEYVEAIRTLLAGGKLDVDGSVVRSHGFSLDAPPAAAGTMPIHIAALSEQMLSQAGRVADGALLNAVPFSHLATARGVVEDAAAAAGRTQGAVPLGADLRIGIATGSRLRRMREVQRAAMAFFGRTRPYNRLFEEAGFTRQAQELRAAWEARDADRATAAVDDEMLDQLVVIGDEETVQRRVAELAAGPLDTVVAFPLWDDEPPAAATQQIIELLSEVAAS